MRSELIQAQDSLAIETGVRTFIEWIRSGKLAVKLYREQNIHAKIYGSSRIVVEPRSPKRRPLLNLLNFNALIRISTLLQRVNSRPDG